MHAAFASMRRCASSGDDGEDASNIYAITDPATEHKGLLIDAFDVFHEICPATCPSALWGTVANSRW
jgi:hypothetical protein